MTASFKCRIPTLVGNLGKTQSIMNLPPNAYYYPPPFIDRALISQDWGDLGYAIDSDGEITDAGGASQVSLVIVTDPEYSGTMTITWEGGPTTCTIVGASIVSSGTRRTVVNYSGGNLTPKFNTSSGLPSNIRVIPTADSDAYVAGDVFNPLYLGYVDNEKYSFIRYMDWMGVNGNDYEVDWADRTPLTYRTYRARAPIEMQIRLCNEASINGWFCIPIAASDDYMTKFAEMVKTDLDSDLAFIVELSNEVWNSGFKKQYNYARNQAHDKWGDSDYGPQWHAMRITQMAKIFDTVMLPDRRKYWVVLSWGKGQIPNASDLLTAPQWLASDPNDYVRPADAVDAVTIASYCAEELFDDSGIAATLDSDESATYAYLATLAPDLVDADKASYQNWVSDVRPYDIPLIGYEGGLSCDYIGAHGNRNGWLFTYSGDMSGFILGETITTDSGVWTGTVDSVGDSSIRIANHVAGLSDWPDSGELVGETSGYTAHGERTAKGPRNEIRIRGDGWPFSPGGGAAEARNRDNWLAAGAVLPAEYELFGTGLFGRAVEMSVGLDSDSSNHRWQEMIKWIADNPRDYTLKHLRRTVDWPA